MSDAEQNAHFFLGWHSSLDFDYFVYHDSRSADNVVSHDFCDVFDFCELDVEVIVADNPLDHSVGRLALGAAGTQYLDFGYVAAGSGGGVTGCIIGRRCGIATAATACRWFGGTTEG